MKELGFKGKTITLEQTLLALRDRTSLALKTSLSHEEVKTFLKAVPNKLNGALKTAYVAAQDDLREIARDSYGKDSHRLTHDGVDDVGMDRIYREIRMDPQRIDRKLNKCYNAVQANSFEDVKALNNE